MTTRVYVVPAVLVVLAALGVLGAGYISIPTLSHVFDAAYDDEITEAVMIVEGVHCYGMADYLRQHIEHVPGLVSMVAYAGKHRVVIGYDADAVQPEDIVAAIEAPSQTEDGPVHYYDVVSCETR